MSSIQFISPLQFPENNQWKLSLQDILIPSLFHISLPNTVDQSKEFEQMVAEVMQPLKFNDQADADNCLNWIVNVYNGIHSFLDVEKVGKDYSDLILTLSSNITQTVYQQKKKDGVMALLNHISHLLQLLDKGYHAELLKYPTQLDQVKNAAELLNTLQVVTDHIIEKLSEKGAKSTVYLEQIANVFSRMLFLVSLVDYFRKAKQIRKSKQVTAIKKVGRNDPCPCESGKKYKKCCGAPS